MSERTILIEPVANVHTVLCHDEFSGRFFMGTIAEIEAAAVEVNSLIMTDGSASLNDFYSSLEIAAIPIGDQMGWSGSKVAVRYGALVTADHRPAVSFFFNEVPRNNFDDITHG